MANDEKPVDDPVKQLTAIPWYDAATMRALLLAVLGLIGQIMSVLGIDTALFNANVGKIVDSVSTIMILGGVVWAAISRARNPTPPIKISQAKADEHNATHVITDGGSKVVIEKSVTTEEKTS